MIAKLALRDDDSAPLALVHRLARLTAARLALLTSSPMGVTAVRGFRGLAAMRPQAELALGGVQGLEPIERSRPAYARLERATRVRGRA